MKRIKSVVKNIPDKKPYIEAITALLSIPVLITVIILNINNLTQKPKSAEPTGTPSPIVKEVILHEPTQTNLKKTSPSESITNTSMPSTTSTSCKKEVGPVIISSPKEGQLTSDNPVNIIIKYEDSSYCSVVWSYRINGGSWSEYSSNSPSIYNVPNGNVKFELRIQSTTSNDQENLERNFLYTGNNIAISPTPTP